MAYPPPMPDEIASMGKTNRKHQSDTKKLGSGLG
jgi:hypothetical protein